jgi:hypothetical protein
MIEGNPPVTINSGGEVYTARGTSARDDLEYTSTAPQYQGIYYKIQLVALSRFDPNNSKFQAVSDIGRIDTEEIVNSGLTRILLTDFFSEAEAKAALRSARSTFSSAYIVKYEDGIRYGKVRL